MWKKNHQKVKKNLFLLFQNTKVKKSRQDTIKKKKSRHFTWSKEMEQTYKRGRISTFANVRRIAVLLRKNFWHAKYKQGFLPHLVTCSSLIQKLFTVELRWKSKRAFLWSVQWKPYHQSLLKSNFYYAAASFRVFNSRSYSKIYSGEITLPY